jgi:tyrosyl-tRNA synthetase
MTAAPASAATPSRHVLDDLQWRGLVAVSTDLAELRTAMDAGPVTFYCGFDPTAPSLHTGSLVQLLTMRRLQEAGHRPIALVGGATGLIGDPKATAERILNDPTVVGEWVDRIRTQARPFLDYDGPNGAVLADNLDWTAPLSAIELLREVGQHFRVNQMLAKEAVSARLESEVGISYTEFSYQILQAYDFLQLYRRYGCTLQTGGSDQWGNLTAGLDLLRRVEGVSAHALATPLVTKADGTKFGKTETGTVWLDADLTSPYAFFQFWVNADDADAASYLRLFSMRSADEVAELEDQLRTQPAARTAQRALAVELTTLVHGAGQAAAVDEASRALFGQGALEALDLATLSSALQETPHVVASPGATITDLLVATGLTSSRAAARRAVDEGGAYVNNVRVTDADAEPDPTAFLHGSWLVLRRGKRSLAGVRRPAS